MKSIILNEEIHFVVNFHKRINYIIYGKYTDREPNSNNLDLDIFYQGYERDNTFERF